uniref:Transcriptional regulatory protein n=1 Tax=Eucampia antarctica TaxID=49252 RepID=A0A7S2WDJ1_9STRA|mmetsp:Transcript_26942/g.25801  ORF Transcript_26942/g.25801 Transcript_26942/m.25801 type:complete len:293 (+) Transcript_26942:17-895(+)
MKLLISSSVVALVLISGASAFSPAAIKTPVVLSNSHKNPNSNIHHPSSGSALFMGRAAAVREKTKSKTDAIKAKTNGIYGKKIIMAVKQGGPDPDANRALGDLIKQAKANSVPVDNINRAIKRASDTSTANFAEGTFEAYGFGGASFVINVLTDNNNRSTSDVKSAVGKNNGKIAETGSVLFMYDLKGKVEVAATLDEEELLMAAIEAGCDDMELVEGDEEGTSIVYTDPKEANSMLEAVKSLGHEKVKMSLSYITKAPVEVSEEEFEKNMILIDALEDLDDVDSVVHNMSN